MTIKRLLCIFFLMLFATFAIAIYAMSSSNWIKEYISHAIIEKFQKDLGCSVRAEIGQWTIFRSQCQLKNVSMRDHDNRWSWHVGTINITFSWFWFMITGNIYLHISSDCPTFYSDANNDYPCIVDHFKQWATLPEGKIKIVVQTMNIGQAYVTVKNQNTHLTGIVRFYASFAHNGMNCQISLRDGAVLYGDQIIGEKIKGTSSVLFSTDHKPVGKYYFHFLTHYYNTTHGFDCVGTFKNGNHDILLNAGGYQSTNAKIIIKGNTFSIRGSAPCSEILTEGTPVGGICEFDLQTRSHQFWNSLRGVLKINNATYHGILLPSLKYSFETKNNTYNGNIVIATDYGSLSGKCIIGNKKVFIGLANVDVCTIPMAGSWLPQQLAIKGIYDTSNKTIKGKINGINQDCSILAGVIKGTDKQVVCEASMDTNMCRACIQIQPQLMLSSFVYAKNDVELLNCCPHNNGCRLTIDCGLCSQYISVIGQGKCIIDIIPHNDSFLLTASTQDLYLRLKQISNGIKDVHVHGKINMHDKCLVIDNAQIAMIKGNILLENARFCFDGAGFASMNIPVTFSDCLLSWEKKASTICSGNMCFNYKKEDKPIISGTVQFDQSFIKENILSSSVDQQLGRFFLMPFLFGKYNPVINILAEFKTPVALSTSAFSTAISGKIMASGCLSQPFLSGNLELQQGWVNFPYKPLAITHGRLYFLSGTVNDLGIDLVAKGKIKKYTVYMNVTGSIQKPQISFHSSPSLSSQQIMALLLGGSDDASLFLALPISLANAVEGFLFGSNDSGHQFYQYIANIFKPLKNIRIIPRFGDAQKEGQPRGALTVEFNDNLRATMHHKFSPVGNTRFEIEYALTDDTLVRALKDERGDIGAEIEKTWKFG